MLLDAEPGFDYTTAMSLMVQCEDQAEIDRIWETMLTAGGEEIQCGWIADKFGVQWQIVPRNMEELMSQGDDPEGRARMMQAMFAMKKLDIQALQDAYDGK